MLPIDVPPWVSWLVIISTILATWGMIAWTLFVMWPFIRWSRRVGDEQVEVLRKAVFALQNRGSGSKKTDLTDLL
jgi:hypothetical protein